MCGDSGDSVMVKYASSPAAIAVTSACDQILQVGDDCCVESVIDIVIVRFSNVKMKFNIWSNSALI